MNQPILTFTSNVAPYSLLSQINYVQTTPGGTNIPVLIGNDSNKVLFRIYNNWALAASIATAYNIQITTYDGASVISHTALTAPVSQLWMHLYENGYGEDSIQPGLLTSYIDNDTAVGGTSTYSPHFGSNGAINSQIRAGSDGNGLGFIEVASYLSVPTIALANTYSFAITVFYNWSS